MMGLSPVRRFTISDGDQGIAQTVAKIRGLVHDGATDQFVNRLAISIVRQAGAAPYDFLAEARAIYAWVQMNIRFVRDVFAVETLRTPREILTTQAGDCDDINAILLPALLMTVGAHTRLVTVSVDPRDPKAFSHIYCELEMPDGSWLPLDAARKNPAFGRGPQSYFRKRIWSLTDSSFHDAQRGVGLHGGLSGYVSDARGMGDDFSDIAGGIASLVGAGGQAAAGIINSLNPRPPVPSLLPGQLPPGQVQVTAASTFPSWMIFAGLGLAALVLLKK